MTQNGKGSARRPQLIPDKQMEDNWREVFKRKEKQRTEKKNNRADPEESKEDMRDVR